MTRSNRGRELAGRLSINPDETPAPPPPRPAPEPPVEPPAAPEPAPVAADTERPSRAPRRPRSGRKATNTPSVPATEAPDILPGRMSYRSFYIDDTPFARYRAAIYWLARNPQAVGEAPENMSQDIEDHMEAVADRLERKFNDGEVFPAPPPSRRKRA